MAPADRAVSATSLGAWLLKADPSSPGAQTLLTGGPFDVTRCVRRSYRTSLMEPGQRVLLWVSGRDPRTPAGIHAGGWVTGVARVAPGGDERRLEVPLRLERLDRPVLREELLADPVLSRVEVIRMPAGSNPSYLSREELARLRELLTFQGPSA